jgi:hypothetical protein
MGDDPRLTLPVTGIAGTRQNFGVISYLDVSNANKTYHGSFYTADGGTTVYFGMEAAQFGRPRPTSPFTWASGDTVMYSGLYQIT